MFLKIWNITLKSCSPLLLFPTETLDSKDIFLHSCLVSELPRLQPAGKVLLLSAGRLEMLLPKFMEMEVGLLIKCSNLRITGVDVLWVEVSLSTLTVGGSPSPHNLKTSETNWKNHKSGFDMKLFFFLVYQN